MHRAPLEGRTLERDEITDIWRIDRSEVISAVYYLVDGSLVLKPERHDVRGWAPRKSGTDTPLLHACYDRGGWFYGLFDGRQLIGVAILDSRLMGNGNDQLQLMFLHISNSYRDNGHGRRLFNAAAIEARRRGAERLYISATPSEHTVNFYLRLGCTVAAEPDPGLWELEPEDIHLEYRLGTNGT